MQPHTHRSGLEELDSSDSDSSGDPDCGQSAFLGYLSVPIGADEPTSHYNPKIGGKPDWILDGHEVPSCGKCKGALSLVLQTFDPIAEVPEFDRVLYLFACNKSTCSTLNTSWYAVRGQRRTEPVPRSSSSAGSVAASPAPAAPSPPSVHALGPPPASPVSLFAQTSSWPEDPSELEQESAVAEPDIETLLRLRDMSLLPRAPTAVQAPVSAQPSQSGGAVLRQHAGARVVPQDELPAYWLEIDDEPQAPPPTRQERYLLELAKQAALEEEEGSEGEAWGDEKYPDSPSVCCSGRLTPPRYEVGKNRAFEKFQRRLLRSPEQVVRYAYGGRPRWISDSKPPSIPFCPACGAHRVLELQLMPPLIYLLGCAPTELDFGTVAVFVCSASCGGDGYRPEFVHVQGV